MTREHSRQKVLLGGVAFPLWSLGEYHCADHTDDQQDRRDLERPEEVGEETAGDLLDVGNIAAEGGAALLAGARRLEGAGENEEFRQEAETDDDGRRSLSAQRFDV